MKTSIFVIIMLLVLGCKKANRYESQFEIATKLLNLIYKNDSSGIYNIMGAKLESIGRDREGVIYDISRLNKLIIRYGMPNNYSYLYREYSRKNAKLVDLMVPIFKGDKGGKVEVALVIYFVKYLPKDKILDFEIESNLEVNGFVSQ